MNARLQAKLAKRRPLPPPQGEAPAHFGSIVRRTSARRRPLLRYLPLLILLPVAWACLFLGARALFHALIFGGIA